MFPEKNFTTDASVREAYSEDASGLTGLPDAVARPSTEAETAEILNWCLSTKTPVTPQGLRSSTVGGPLAMGGVALSMEKMDRVVSIDPVNRTAVLEPGVVLGDFKRTLKESGLFFAPDPTSEHECTIGGAVAANASGARSYIYGATRPWVRAMRLVMGNGSITEVHRSDASKNTVGYFGFQNPVDLLVGSEGTLGIVTRVTVDLLPLPPGFIAAMAFFPTLDSALAFVRAADTARRSGAGVRPRCLELFDAGSLEMVRPQAGGLGIPKNAAAGIFFEQECEPENEGTALEAWLSMIEICGGLADDTIAATNEAQQEELRRLRHALPSTMNEKGRRARDNGGLKVSTDWAVPLPAMERMVEDATRIVDEDFGGFYIRYGHIGNGHPHFNMIAEDGDALAKARRAAHRMCLRAVELGGTVTAEHGVGKVKREYVRHQYPEWVVEAMRAVKKSLDPQGLLAPGNIFSD